MRGTSMAYKTLIGNPRHLFVGGCHPNIPLNERENVCCVIGDEPISWKLAKLYIDQKSDIGKKILENLKEIKVIE